MDTHGRDRITKGGYFTMTYASGLPLTSQIALNLKQRFTRCWHNINRACGNNDVDKIMHWIKERELVVEEMRANGINVHELMAER